jgi:hypothetical protein
MASIMDKLDFDFSHTFPKIAGIKTVLPDYTLAWHINNSFDMNFSLNLDWEKKGLENLMSKHRHYYYPFEDVELTWHLIKNKGTHAYFFQTKPLFDFFLICDGDDIYNYFERAIEAIKKNPDIENIFEFNFELIPKKAHFYNNILNNKIFIEDFYV